MVAQFVKGETKDYVAQIDFGLNFEDRSVASVKVKKGRIVSYDGEIASYTNDKGQVITGPTMSLKSVINKMGWLLPSNGQSSEKKADLPSTEGLKASTDISKVPVQESQKDFDTLKGGSFETAMVNDPTIHVASTGKKAKKEKKKIEQIQEIPDNYDDLKGGTFETVVKQANSAKTIRKHQVIKQQDLVVKDLPQLKKAEVTNHSSEKLEIAGDQVAVKKVGERMIVSSTTVTKKEPTIKSKIIRADEMNADSVQELNFKKQPKSSEKSSYVVDDKTPRAVSDMTLTEVRKATKVIAPEESQEATVVGKVNLNKNKVQEIEGITLKKTKTPIQDITLSKVKSPKEMTITTTVGSPSSDLNEEQLNETPEKVPEETPEEVSEETPVKETVVAESSLLDDLDFDAVLKKKTPEKQNTSESSDYLSILPDDWGKMHWVKKEIFIKALTDKKFIEFILSVETVKAVQNACKERLKELEQEAAG